MRTELDIIRSKIRERMNHLVDAVAMGAAQDYPAYTKMVGVLEGLALAERDVLDQIERLNED